MFALLSRVTVNPNSKCALLGNESGKHKNNVTLFSSVKKQLKSWCALTKL